MRLPVARPIPDAAPRLLVAAIGALLLGASLADAAADRSLYTVVLEAPSAGRRISMSRAKGASRVPARVAASSFATLARAVARSQDPVIAVLEARGVEVVGSVRNVLNAVFIRAAQSQAEAVAEVPGVRVVARSRRLRFQLDGVAQVVGLAAARASGRGTGAGVRIAIIDSGLDFDHPAFRDESLPAVPGYPRGRPADLRFASRKVIAVRSYMHLRNSGDPRTSTPDDRSPRDTRGHGTAVAMIAAGARVESPAGSLEGIAPKAYLGVYKVIGTEGVNSEPTSAAVIAAIDDAITDGMDILNLSLGAPARLAWNAYGGACGLFADSLDCDPLAVAAQSAVVDFGRVVVAAAGNAGWNGLQSNPARNTIASPAVAPDVIAVAATANSKRFVQRVRSGPLDAPALSGSGPQVDGQLTAPLAVAADAGDPLACRPFHGSPLDDRIVLIQRGSCDFLDKVEHVDAAGAVGAVVYDSYASDELQVMALIADTDIPAYFVGARDGASLLSLARSSPSGRPASVTLDAALSSRQQDWRRVAPYSARGPSPGLNLKPDIAAPGDHVYTAASERRNGGGGSFSPTGFRGASGTSMAAPVVAGAAALVWEALPDLTAREVSSALINTASRAVMEDGEIARAASVGAGLLDLAKASGPIATVEPPVVGFGVLDGARFPAWQEVLVTNRGSATHAYRVAVEARDVEERAAVTVDGYREVDFRLEPGQFARLRVTLNGRLPAPGSYEGHLRVSREAGGGDLRVPYLYVVGDGVPHNSFALSDGFERGLAGEVAVRELAGKFVDRFGAPVPSLPVRFSVRQGAARIQSGSVATDEFGVASAVVEFGGAPGLQEVVAAGGGLEIPFRFEAARPRPHIAGVTNDAGREFGLPVAPGSIIAVLGAGLAAFPGESPHSPAPLALKAVSASFDYPDEGLSVAAPVVAVGEREVRVQVPWEFAGLNFAVLKVRVRDRLGFEFASEPVSIDLADAAPGIYLRDVPGQGLAALWHPDGSPVDRARPARPGGEVTAHVTGLGPLVRRALTGVSGSEPNPTRHAPTVRVGGLAARVAFSGTLPGAVGLGQVRFTVPPNAPPGDLDLQLEIHGATSNAAKIAVR